MKAIAGFLLFLLGSLNGFGQLYDAQWVIGPNISVLDFQNPDTVDLYTISSNMVIFLTSASISGLDGNLLYFSNGIFISDKSGDTLPNGYGLNPCSYTTEWADNGLDIPQAALFIPRPGDSTGYYLIHFSDDTLNSNLPGTLYYTEIRDSGLGYVRQKNIPFGKGIFREGGLTACKHANGRDYWVVMGLDGTNEYYKYLFTPDSVFGPFVQDIGPYFGGFYDLPYSKFSQDGTKYATGIYADAPILVMDFDRCSGEFSNPVTIFNNASSDSSIDTISGCSSLEFSPDNRFLYIANSNNLVQYDLSSANIQDSVELYRANRNDFYMISTLQAAPNGKIYASTWNGGAHFVHVINDPDEKGDDCNFVYGGQPTLSINSAQFPNEINYKLGPLIGSSCDTIVTASPSLSKGEELMRIIPDPADKYVYVEMGMQGNYEFQLLNEAGQLIDSKETRQVDIFDTEGLASGVYFVKVVDKNDAENCITKKVIISH